MSGNSQSTTRSLLRVISSSDFLSVIRIYNTHPELFTPEVIAKVSIECKKAMTHITLGQAIAAMSPKARFQYRVACKYRNKLENAARRGLEFTLTLTSVSNLLKAKKCFFTGLPLDENTLTFDRVDNSKGYIQGNTVACHKEVNAFKATMENPETLVNLELVSKMVKKWEKSL